MYLIFFATTCNREEKSVEVKLEYAVKYKVCFQTPHALHAMIHNYKACAVVTLNLSAYAYIKAINYASYGFICNAQAE